MQYRTTRGVAAQSANVLGDITVTRRVGTPTVPREARVESPRKGQKYVLISQEFRSANRARVEADTPWVVRPSGARMTPMGPAVGRAEARAAGEIQTSNEEVGSIGSSTSMKNSTNHLDFKIKNCYHPRYYL